MGTLTKTFIGIALASASAVLLADMIVRTYHALAPY